MRITSLEEYGLRSALCLARAYEDGLRLSSSDLSRKEGMSLEYASKILHLFKKAGILSSTRGAKGGYILVLAPGKLSLRDVLSALQEKRSAQSKDSALGRDSLEDSVDNESQKSFTRPLWSFLFEGFDEVLEHVTLADLLLNSDDLKVKLRTATEKQMDEFFKTSA